MAIYKNNKKVVGVYKGNTPISTIYEKNHLVFFKPKGIIDSNNVIIDSSEWSKIELQSEKGDLPSDLNNSIDNPMMYESKIFSNTDGYENATMKITFRNTPNFYFYIRNLAYNGSGFNSVYVSKLDTEDFWEVSHHSPNPEKCMELQSDATSSKRPWRLVSIKNDGGEHFVYVVYSIIPNQFGEIVFGQKKGLVCFPYQD